MFITVASFWSFLTYPTSLLIPDEHGWAYLTRVVNKTNFPGLLEFKGSGAGIDSFQIPTGQDLGDPINSTEEIAGEFIAPVGAIRKTRIWKHGASITKDKDTRVDKLPTISGAGIKEIQQFDASKILMLQPMYENAIAWLAGQDLTSAQNPKLNMTISFMVYVQDKGDAIVYFYQKETIGPDWIWKIVFSSSESGNLKIFKKNGDTFDEVVSVPNAVLPQAKIIAGKFTRFWISLRGNQIVVGQGEDGQNPLVFWEEEVEPRQIKRLGFSCTDSPISIARIMTSAGIYPEPIGEPVAVFNDEKIKTSSISLRESGFGLFIFDRQDEQISLELSSVNSKNEDRISLDFVGDSVEIKHLIKDGVKSSSKFQLKKEQKTVWFALDGNKLLFGSGPVCKDGFLSGVFYSQLIKDFGQLKFLKPPSQTIALYSRVKLSSRAWDTSQTTNSMFSGNVRIYQPYQYQFDQQGPSISGTDLIYKKSYILGKAPQQSAIYPFELIIESDGTPTLDWHNKPVNVGKFFINAAAMALRISEAGSYMAAMNMSDEETDEVKVDLKTTAKNIGFSLAGGAMGAMAALLEAEADSGYRDADAYGYTERANLTTGKADIEKDKKAADDRQNFQILFEKIKSLNFRTKEDLDYAMQLYVDALTLIKDKKIISDDQRAKMVDDIAAISASALIIYENPKMVADKIIRIIIDALSNTALFDQSSIKHLNFIYNLNAILQRFFPKLLFEIGREKISVPNFNGKFLWTGKTFDGEGSIYFKAKGNAGLFVHLLPTKDPNFEAKIGQLTWLQEGSPIYEIGLGIDNNSKSCLRVSHRGSNVQELFSSKNNQALISNFNYKPFWVSFSKNIISVGQGEWGDGKFLEWTDPYPAFTKLAVGLSGQSGIIEITDFRVGPPVESFFKTVDGKTEKVIPEKTDDELDRDKKIAEKKAKTGFLEANAEKLTQLAEAESPLNKNELAQTDQLVGTDQLDNLSFELEFGPLFSELEYDKYKRDQKEQVIVDKVISQQSDKNTMQNAENADARDVSDQAAQARASRGQVQKMQAGGMTSVIQEGKTVLGDVKAAGQGVKNIAKDVKKAISNIGRKTAVASAKTAGKIKRASEKEKDGSVMTGDDHADAAATRAQRIAKNQENREARDQTQQKPQKAESEPNKSNQSEDKNDQGSESDNKKDKEDKPKDEDSGKDSQRSAFWDTSIGRDLSNVKKIGVAVGSGQVAADLKTIPAKFVHEFGLSKSDTVKITSAESGRNRLQDSNSIGGSARALSKNDSEPDNSDDWKKGTRSFDASMAIAKTKADSVDAEKKAKLLSDELDAKKAKFTTLSDEQGKIELQREIGDLMSRKVAADDEAKWAKDIAEKTYYHGKAGKVLKARDDYVAAVSELKKVQQSRTDLEKRLLANPSDKKLADELEVIKHEESDVSKKVAEERKSLSSLFDPYQSRSAALGSARKKIDDLREEVNKAKNELEATGGQESAEKLADLEKQLSEEKVWAQKLSIYTDDDAAPILKAKKLDDEDRDGISHDPNLSQKEIEKIIEEADQARANYEFVGFSSNPVQKRVSSAALNIGGGVGMAILSGNQGQPTPEEIAAQEAAKAQAAQIINQDNFALN